MAFPTGIPQLRFDLSRRPHRLSAIVLLAVVYYLSARWSLLLAFEGTNASPVWPPSGLALGALLLLGRKAWPAIILGAFAANLATFTANHVTGPVTAYVSLSIAIGNTLEALAGFQLLRYLKIADAPLEQPQGVFKFMMAALLMCIVSAGVGTVSLILGGIASGTLEWPIWINWWLGDVGGVLIVTPFILAWLSGRDRLVQFQLKPMVSMGAVLAGFALLVFLIFRGTFSAGHADRLLLYLCMPYVAWVAYHFGQRGVSLASLLLGGISVWGTTHNLGPFATGDLNNSLILLVSFIALCCLTGLILASDITQRTRFKDAPITIGDVKIPWLTLLTALGVTVFVWHMVSVDTERAAEERFKGLAGDVISDIDERMADYEQILRGGAGLFAALQDVTRAEWHSYAQHLEIGKTLPGMQSFAFAEWVDATEKPAYVERVRKEGFVDYAIQPAGDRGAYLPVHYIEPLDWRNQRAFGYDMLSEAVRRKAIIYARDSGMTTLSGKIRLAQETGENVQAGFVMYMPVYRRGAPTATVAERRTALRGYVCSGFRMDDLMQGILHHASPLGLEIFDGRQTDFHARMYASASLAGAAREATLRPLVADFPLEFGNHEWTLRMTSLPVFEATVDRQKAQIILVSGIVVSLLLFILVRSLAMTRENALALADGMTTALRQSETNLRLLNSRMELAAEAGCIGIWDWDVQTNRMDWDERMYEMYQIDPATADNTFDMWRKRLHPNDVEPIEWALSEALAFGRPYSAEFNIVLHGGQLRKIKANGIVLRDETGEPRRMIGINVDITDLRHAEESLRASEERFRGVFEHSPIGMAIVSLDGRWLDVNGAICEILGYGEEELERLTFQDITHPDDLQQDLAYVEELIAGKIRSYQMEKRYFRKDGQIVWVLLTVALMRDEFNEPLHFLSQIMNITDRVHAAAKLQSTLALQSAILSSSNLSMIATDTDGLIVSFNRAAQRMLQYSEQEVIGKQISTLIHDGDEMVRRAAKRGMEMGRSIEPGFEVLTAKPREGYADEHEWVYIRKDGTRFPVHLSMTAIRDETGGITGFLGIASDIADRKQKEQAIAAALAEKEVLLKEVYHRVKNNLQVITSLINLQLRTLPEGPARTALKESVGRVRAMALVHEKLYQSSNLSSIKLDGYIQDLCYQLGSAAAAAERGIRLIVEIMPIEIGLELAVPLGLLLNELISNSLKHGFPDGRPGEIRISLARLDAASHLVRLEVADNGIGLPPDLDIHTHPSLGLKLANTLGAQMDAVFRLESENGTHASLIFRVDETVQHEIDESSIGRR